MTTPADLLRNYLEDAIAAEKAFENRFRAFASEGDDDEVREVFASCADQARVHAQFLTERLQTIGGTPSALKETAASLFGSMPRAAQTGHIQEERTVQDLIAAYTLAAGACAMYESMSSVAHNLGDLSLASRAREMQRFESEIAEKLFHFIPSRSIIAYNMLTIDEVDPAVQTKIGEASWT